ncbi:MAG: hypothetical protein OEY01_03515 [Desulfobulbaceae bacterium]|nr:hypothetical protein [Desulfobulbaceae bacterium]
MSNTQLLNKLKEIKRYQYWCLGGQVVFIQDISPKRIKIKEYTFQKVKKSWSLNTSRYFYTMLGKGYDEPHFRIEEKAAWPLTYFLHAWTSLYPEASIEERAETARKFVEGELNNILEVARTCLYEEEKPYLLSSLKEAILPHKKKTTWDGYPIVIEYLRQNGVWLLTEEDERALSRVFYETFHAQSRFTREYRYLERVIVIHGFRAFPEREIGRVCAEILSLHGMDLDYLASEAFSPTQKDSERWQTILGNP